MYLVVVQITTLANLVITTAQGVTQVAVWACGNYLILSMLFSLFHQFVASFPGSLAIPYLPHF
jgi:hypothetical protein